MTAESTHKSYPKAEIVRDKSYRRWVAGLACRACGLDGWSQAAHVPPDGKGIKQSDTEIFPLCCTRPGVIGCHAEYDQYIMIPDSQEARRVGRQWAAETRAMYEREGK